VRARAALACILLPALAACAPKTNAPAAVALDCAQGYDAMKAKIAAQPGVVAAPMEPSEPYRAYSTADGKASWFVTEPGAPAHPAILMQQATPQGMKDTGCAFGDQAAYGELQVYLKSLSVGRK
jgi:hypothetical protein